MIKTNLFRYILEKNIEEKKLYQVIIEEKLLRRFCVDFKQTLAHALTLKFKDLVKILLCEFNIKHDLFRRILLEENLAKPELESSRPEIEREINLWNEQANNFRINLSGYDSVQEQARKSGAELDLY